MNSNSSVLFVFHSVIGRALVAVITGKDFIDIKSIETLEHTGILTFDIDEDKNYRIVSYNCAKYLG